MPLFREQLACGQTVRFSPRGTSMLPMLRQGIDQVVLSPLPEKLRKFDLPLYQRDDGHYVLHRIVGIRDGRFTCLGDNQFVKEYDLRQDQMIAVVSAFTRDGRQYSVTDPGYWIYCRVWYYSRHLRRLAQHGMRFLRRLMK